MAALSAALSTPPATAVAEALGATAVIEAAAALGAVAVLGPAAVLGAAAAVVRRTARQEPPPPLALRVTAGSPEPWLGEQAPRPAAAQTAHAPRAPSRADRTPLPSAPRAPSRAAPAPPPASSNAPQSATPHAACGNRMWQPHVAARMWQVCMAASAKPAQTLTAPALGAVHLADGLWIQLLGPLLHLAPTLLELPLAPSELRL